MFYYCLHWDTHDQNRPDFYLSVISVALQKSDYFTRIWTYLFYWFTFSRASMHDKSCVLLFMENTASCYILSF